MNCLLTGSTGIVGSHILFEWLQKAILEKSVNQLYIVIRPTEITAKQRLLNILNDVSRPKFMDAFSIESCLSKLTVISADLASLTKTQLSNYNFDTILHCAGSTSLVNSSSAEKQVHNQNYEVTQHLLKSMPKQVKRFIYISTAFSFGIQNQKVSETIEKYTVNKFRNPYEGSKYKSEQWVKQACAKKNIQSQILRPSIICGRLLEAPFFETPKYDVFYSWPIFLKKHAEKAKDNFRIWIDKKSGLNIVPVDFVAKAVLHAYLSPEIKELNIVNPKQILHKEYVGKVLDFFNVTNYEYVSQKPENQNVMEQLYYKTIGSVFEKYIAIPDLQFETDLILKLIKSLNLDINLGVHQNFMNLINYSVIQNFKKSY